MITSSNKRKKRRWVIKTREYLISVNKNYCWECGEYKNRWHAMDLHHLNRKNKNYSITKARPLSPKNIYEIEKVISLCTEHHRLHHDNNEEFILTLKYKPIDVDLEYIYNLTKEKINNK